MCVQGRKLVVFITGKCPQRCFYCPVSEDKFGKDDVYANEWKILDPKNPLELLEEAKLTGATGAGITGGDPLANLGRTVEYIKILKKEFGKKFHIHLYTPMALSTKSNLKKLYDAGLDEIRFHPNLDNDLLWKRIDNANNFNWKVGVEIPCVPGYEEKTKKLIDFLEGKIKFINFNELERSDTELAHYKLDEMGFKQRNDTTYGIAGSRELGMKLIKYAYAKGIPAHFCTAKLKDLIQVGNRLKIRAKNIALPYDRITDEGLLLRGVIYIKGLEPGFDYKKRMKRRKSRKELELIKKVIQKEFKIKDIHIDEIRSRFIVPRETLKDKEKFRKLNLIPAFVEEYPTSDAFPIEIDFI